MSPPVREALAHETREGSHLAVRELDHGARRLSRTLAGGSPSRAGAVSGRGRARPAARRAP